MHLHKNHTVLISPMEPKIIIELNNIGINTIETKAVTKLIPYEQYHADMQLLVIGTKAFICGNSSYLIDVVRDNNLKDEVCEELKGEYPSNVRLNAALVGNRLICKKTTLALKVTNYCETENIKIIDVKQGYSKCSTLVINDNAIITADKGIYENAVANGIESLLIRPGFVELKGANYGFIGGCSGIIGDTVVFFGDLNTHPDAMIIRNFISEQGYDIMSLIKNTPLKDIGGFVQIN